MRFEKKFLDNMERCYCSSYIYQDNKPKILLASEAIDGPCYAYFGDNFENKEVVWEKAGGTMSIVEIPGTNGEFLATQRFFPGFQSEESKVVWGKYENNKWVIRDYISIPFLHRFDLLKSGDKIYFFAAVLCGSKKDREDWSDPGKVLVGEFTFDINKKPELTEIKSGLTKNHGYVRADYEGRESAFITAENGIFVFTPPEEKDSSWKIVQLSDNPTSDIAVFDLDGDGVDELVTIEPFHGNKFKIYKKDGDKYKEVYEYPDEINFAHAIWAGTLAGEPVAVCGIRRVNGELFYVAYDKNTNEYKAHVIEMGVGTANVDVLHLKNKDVLIAANHTKNEAALYFFEA